MDHTDLPNDAETLKRVIATMQQEYTATIETLQRHNADLASQLAALKRRNFGRRSERIVPNQLSLLGEDTDPAGVLSKVGKPAVSKAVPRRKPRKRRGGGRGSRSLPKHLDAIDVTSTDPGPTACPGCSGELKKVGEDWSERLEYIPGQFKKLRIRRIKRACPRCPSAGIFTQPAPPFALEKALAADGLLAKIVADKFADHIPLNRQSKRFSRECGVTLSVATMCGWLRAVSGLLRHVVDAMTAELVAGTFIQSDATGLPVLEGSQNKPRRGHLWSYTDGSQVVMKATMTGQQTHPAAVLEGFAGTLLTDGAGATNLISSSADVSRAGCWAHARRKFFEARTEAPAKAGVALATIREIFIVEREVGELDAQTRSRVRKERLGGPLSALKRRLDTWSTTARPQSALGKAITYARNQWETLIVFLDDGQVPAHNNTSERLLRGPVVGRKNWMFTGSEGGATTAAVCFSIVASCMMAGIDPYEYLRDVLSLLPDAKPDEVRALTPRLWAQRHGPKIE